VNPGKAVSYRSGKIQNLYKNIFAKENLQKICYLTDSPTALIEWK